MALRTIDARDGQGLPCAQGVRVLQPVGGEQSAQRSPIAVGDAGQGLAGRHHMRSAGGRHTQALANPQAVGIIDAVERPQCIGRGLVAQRNLGQRFAIADAMCVERSGGARAGPARRQAQPLTRAQSARIADAVEGGQLGGRGAIARGDLGKGFAAADLMVARTLGGVGSARHAGGVAAARRGNAQALADAHVVRAAQTVELLQTRCRSAMTACDLGQRFAATDAVRDEGLALACVQFTVVQRQIGTREGRSMARRDANAVVGWDQQLSLAYQCAVGRIVRAEVFPVPAGQPLQRGPRHVMLRFHFIETCRLGRSQRDVEPALARLFHIHGGDEGGVEIARGKAEARMFVVADQVGQ